MLLQRFESKNLLGSEQSMTFVKNVRSAIEQLNGRPTALEEAGRAMKAYREDESLETFERLRAAFHKLPYFDHQFTFGSRFERYIDIQRKPGIQRPKPE